MDKIFRQSIHLKKTFTRNTAAIPAEGSFSVCEARDIHRMPRASSLYRLLLIQVIFQHLRRLRPGSQPLGG